MRVSCPQLHAKGLMSKKACPKEQTKGYILQVGLNLVACHENAFTYLLRVKMG